LISINNSYYKNNPYDYFNKAITNKDTDNNNEAFNIHDSTVSQLMGEDRKLLKEEKITQNDYGCIMIHAFVSRIHIINGRPVLKINGDYSQDWASTFSQIQTSHKSSGLSQDYDEDKRLQNIITSLE